MSLIVAGEDPTKADAKDPEATLSKAYQQALEHSASTAH